MRNSVDLDLLLLQLVVERAARNVAGGGGGFRVARRIAGLSRLCSFSHVPQRTRGNRSGSPALRIDEQQFFFDSDGTHLARRSA